MLLPTQGVAKLLAHLITASSRLGIIQGVPKEAR